MVSDQQGRALYFSRAPIPWPRDQVEELKSNLGGLPENLNAQRHIGIYAYRAKLLRSFTQWAPAPLEVLECLEQLRILSQGEKIQVSQACKLVPPGVDTPEDLEKIREAMRV